MFLARLTIRYYVLSTGALLSEIVWDLRRPDQEYVHCYEEILIAQLR